MPRPNRKDIVDPTEVGIYHCYSRCVQGAYLCGFDAETNTNYDHRKVWIEDRQELSAGVYAMELLGYAILDNHMHHVIRTRPDLAELWSDEEVIRRWYRLHPQKNERGEVVELSDDRIRELLKDTARVAEWRRRLASLSWYMKDLKEDIAKRANRESGKSGHFFDARFNSPRLADLVTLLICLLYVDLNAVRAAIVDRPESYPHCSFHRRSRGHRIRQRTASTSDAPEQRNPDAVLQPICELGEPANQTAPMHRPSDKGILPMTSEQYLELVDWVGREERSDKRGAIPRELAPIMERLGCNCDLLSNAATTYEQSLHRAGRQVQLPDNIRVDEIAIS